MWAVGRCGRIENTIVCDTFPTESILMAVRRPERRQNGHATWRDVWVVIRGVTRQETRNMTRAPEPRKARDAQQEEALTETQREVYARTVRTAKVTGERTTRRKSAEDKGQAYALRFEK